eukprot:scaffold53078_cov32-Cyclotella_meneghiniana.AAC.3
MKYLLVISSLIVAGLIVAVAQVVDHGRAAHPGSGSVASPVFTTESVDEAVSCVPNLRVTHNCDYCCSKYCVWTIICFPSRGAVLDDDDDDYPVLEPVVQPVSGRRPTPSSSYVASPVFTADS